MTTIQPVRAAEAQAVDHTSPSVWFVGDLDDPWVVSIADALPTVTHCFSCPAELPDGLLDTAGAPEVLVLHRAVLTGHDAERIARFRSSQSPAPRVVLCFGPHVRHDDLMAWAELVDATVPEATASETLARRLAEGGELIQSLSPLRARPRITVVSTNPTMQQMLADACDFAGYPVALARRWSDAPARGPAVWDVPTLDPEWADELARRATAGAVVAMLGFADRALVSQARASGARACLELPFDVQDVAAALDRVTGPPSRPAHTVPPSPASWRRHPPPRAVAGTSRDA
jgi:hypothetical protein